MDKQFELYKPKKNDGERWGLRNNAVTYITHYFPFDLLHPFVFYTGERYMARWTLEEIHHHMPHCRAHTAAKFQAIMQAKGMFDPWVSFHLGIAYVTMNTGKSYSRKTHVTTIETQYELIFDLDLDGYDTYRNADMRRHFLCQCADKKTVCKSCWLLVGMASIFLQHMFPSFGQALWVYSGGKVQLTLFYRTTYIFLKNQLAWDLAEKVQLTLFSSKNQLARDLAKNIFH